MKWRAARRGFVLFLTLLVCAVRFAVVTLVAGLRGKPVTSMQRAEWMQFCGRSLLSAMGIQYRVEGAAPLGPVLIVANHLSYLDIVICAAAAPCAFVAKDEICAWPFFGKLARLGGTIFLDRQSRMSAWDAAESMALRLAEGIPVLVFPEGTSTDGRELQRFHSTLFEPAVESDLAVVPAAVCYEPTGDLLRERDICWFGDALFLPHLMQVLGLLEFEAVVRFGKPELFPDRRTAAWRSHDAIEAMRRQLSKPQTALAVERLRFPLFGSPGVLDEGGAVESRTTRLVETRNSR